MRPFILCNLTILFLTCMAISWQLQQYIPKLFIASSHIPQFALDTRHPWLEENRGYLERLDNPAQALCSLESKLRLANADETRTYPADLFKYLRIDNNRAGVDRPGWKNALLRLKEMLDCPAALHDVEDFNVQIWISDGSYGIGFSESSQPPTELPRLFIERLRSMPRLQKLEWNTFSNGNDVFQEAFRKANLTLPSVRHLVPAVYTDFLVGMCPAVLKLHSGRSVNTADYWREEPERDARLQLVESTRAAKNLTEFSMKGEWQLQYLETLLQSRPNIATLEIDGELVPYHYHAYDSLDEPQDQILKGYLDILSRFPRLEKLWLPPSSGLGLGFDGGAWCGNAYFGTEGREYGRSVSRESAETTEAAAKIVLSRLSNLKSLCIGGTCADITRDEHGRFGATWPWTGRMTEWTYEIWPEKKMFWG